MGGGGSPYFLLFINLRDYVSRSIQHDHVLFIYVIDLYDTHHSFIKKLFINVKTTSGVTVPYQFGDRKLARQFKLM